MQIKSDEEIRIEIDNTIEKHSVKRCGIGAAMGYNGDSNIRSLAVRRILNGDRDLMVWHINSISHFLRYPVGYFLFGDEYSDILQVDEDRLVDLVQSLFFEEDKKPRGKRKTRSQLGSVLGYASDMTSHINTTNRILKRTTKLRVQYLQLIADFFEKPVEWFLKRDEG